MAGGGWGKRPARRPGGRGVNVKTACTVYPSPGQGGVAWPVTGGKGQLTDELLGVVVGGPSPGPAGGA